MAKGKGNNNGNGWWQCKRDGSSDGQWQLQQQWPTATAIGYGNVDSFGNKDGDGDEDGKDDEDGDSNCNGNG